MARLVEYVNPNPHAIQIVGPNREQVRVSKFSKIVLSDWFIDRYTPKFLRVVRILGEDNLSPPQMNVVQEVPNIRVMGEKQKSMRTVRRARQVVKKSFRGVRSGRSRYVGNKPIVGKALGHAADLYNQAVQDVQVAISDGIGVGVLSFNRLKPLQRLIGSIRKYTDLSRTTIFISDDGSTNESLKDWLDKQPDIIVLKNSTNIGIAGNTNRLMNCLKRFKYKIILNDDVEILSHAWERFYFEAMQNTGYHHFCYRQEGLHGASRQQSQKKSVNGKIIYSVTDKPHGAVMAFDDKAFDAVGYFDEALSQYGMEHVDWSNRVGVAGLQPYGFHDVEGSDRFFAIHREKSALITKGQHLRENKAKYANLRNDKSRIHISATSKANVPAISVVIPVRDIGRSDCVNMVIRNIKAQRYPEIEIIVVEQDQERRFNGKEGEPFRYMFVANQRPNQDFNKSKAFNAAVSATSYENVILHDADIIVPVDYVARIVDVLIRFDSCHIGSKVLYLDRQSTLHMCQIGNLSRGYNCERAVGYFEGGSIAFKKEFYYKVGGFNEAFEGYGVEDCDFFERLKDNTRFFNTRSVDMFHLWHSRTPGWNDRHARNKDLLKAINRDMSRLEYLNHLVAQIKAKYSEAGKYV